MGSVVMGRREFIASAAAAAGVAGEARAFGDSDDRRAQGPQARVFSRGGCPPGRAGAEERGSGDLRPLVVGAHDVGCPPSAALGFTQDSRLIA